MDDQSAFTQLDSFFQRSVCQKAGAPLREDIEIGIQTDTNHTFSLIKNQGKLSLLRNSPSAPDLTFFLGSKSTEALSDIESDDIGEIGVTVLGLMLEQAKDYRISAKIHTHPITLFRKGYMGVLALGGSPVLSFLAKKGIGNLSSIKAAFLKLKE
ncbi:MAG: hypothetical protein EB078_04295 [Proteobacteria bacterium]|nr:hypothetical protein [Pseudomonadota bacterium]NDC23841.1 hypothetical protein [Pseudomonadota bacterium]NDD04104.1 hypothetical protein [Pseudomonadota bacterium]NDG26617.1 hypothetical protein [Pseudomonadota bacterium]